MASKRRRESLQSLAFFPARASAIETASPSIAACNHSATQSSSRLDQRVLSAETSRDRVPSCSEELRGRFHHLVTWNSRGSTSIHLHLATSNQGSAHDSGASEQRESKWQRFSNHLPHQATHQKRLPFFRAETCNLLPGACTARGFTVLSFPFWPLASALWHSPHQWGRGRRSSCT